MRHMCNTAAMLKAFADSQAAQRSEAIALAHTEGMRISDALKRVEASRRYANRVAANQERVS